MSVWDLNCPPKQQVAGGRDLGQGDQGNGVSPPASKWWRDGGGWGRETGSNGISPPVSEWQREQGRFLAINLTCMSSACPKSPDGLSPSAHLADGTADLILVRECSALGFLRHLSRHMDHRDQVGGWARPRAYVDSQGPGRGHGPGPVARGG